MKEDIRYLGIWMLSVLAAIANSAGAGECRTAFDMEIQLPYLEESPEIDGDLSEWREFAHHDGIWDIHRLKHTNWFEPHRNRLTDHGDEPSPENDLSARYYMAWDEDWIYLGAEVRDNRNDVEESRHEPKRWYYKDAICWFIEAPRDEVSELFGQGDNAFCFVIDPSYPDYGAWWRHGDENSTYIEEPIPVDAVEYRIRMNPLGESPGDFILEAKVRMEATFGASDSNWRAPRLGDVYSVEIVHTDPDGGEYGGHFIIYGTGDDDASWAKLVLDGPKVPLGREEK
ncbi:MAG: hypothetical protein AB3N63_17880 [Puniceicoccaceae bacterium]